MTINVSKDVENAINAAVQSGRFASAGEIRYSEAAARMRRVFAGTYYWIALLNDRDQGHAA
jgi:hypothetical protein